MKIAAVLFAGLLLVAAVASFPLGIDYRPGVGAVVVEPYHATLGQLQAKAQFVQAATFAGLQFVPGYGPAIIRWWA